LKGQANFEDLSLVLERLSGFVFGKDINSVIYTGEAKEIMKEIVVFVLALCVLGAGFLFLFLGRWYTGIWFAGWFFLFGGGALALVYGFALFFSHYDAAQEK